MAAFGKPRQAGPMSASGPVSDPQPRSLGHVAPTNRIGGRSHVGPVAEVRAPRKQTSHVESERSIKAAGAALRIARVHAQFPGLLRRKGRFVDYCSQLICGGRGSEGWETGMKISHFAAEAVMRG